MLEGVCVSRSVQRVDIEQSLFPVVGDGGRECHWGWTRSRRCAPESHLPLTRHDAQRRPWRPLTPPANKHASSVQSRWAVGGGRERKMVIRQTKGRMVKRVERGETRWKRWRKCRWTSGYWIDEPVLRASRGLSSSARFGGEASLHPCTGLSSRCHSTVTLLTVDNEFAVTSHQRRSSEDERCGSRLYAVR